MQAMPAHAGVWRGGWFLSIPVNGAGLSIAAAMPGRNRKETDMDMQLPEGLLKSDGDPPKDRLAATAAQGISTALVSNECRHGAAALGLDR